MKGLQYTLNSQSHGFKTSKELRHLNSLIILNFNIPKSDFQIKKV